jgi:hypothetical protein
MKIACSLFLSASLACCGLGQSTAPSPQETKVQQPVQIQMECRDLGPDKSVAADETLINGMACRPVKAKQPTASAVVSDSKAVPASLVTSNATSDAKKDPSPAVGSEAKKDTAAQPAVIRQCVILKRMGPADEITSHLYSFGIRGKQFQYVEGDFPPGVKFHGRLTDNDVRKVQTHNGKVAILEPGYTADNLKAARESCKQP